MPIDICPNKKCGKMIDIDGYVEHGVRTLFYCECGKIYDMPRWMRLVEVPKEEVDLTDVKEKNRISRFHGDNRGLYINKTRWKKPSMNSRDFVLAVLDEKFKKQQPLGLVKYEPDDKKYGIGFTAGIFEDVDIEFAPLGAVVDPKIAKKPFVTIDLSDTLSYGSASDEITKEKKIDSIPIDDRILTICSSRKFFVNYANNLVEKIKPKRKLPLFVRSLSELSGW